MQGCTPASTEFARMRRRQRPPRPSGTTRGSLPENAVQMGALGAYVPSVTIFMLKNLSGWTDKLEQRNTTAVVLKFDAQDAEAR